MEVQNARLQVEIAERQVREKEVAYNAVVEKTFRDADRVPSDWTVDLKAGTMAKKEPTP